jgi:eukaryotic-like serine/threonine-protein kinase
MTLTPPDFSAAEGNLAQSQTATGPAPANTQTPFDVADALIGRNLGHFRVESRLGSGAMAAVYRASDLILDRQVALKVLLPGADDVVRERFRQEARTVSVLDHPHIVRTLQVGLTDGITYIAMDLVEGTSLAELLGEQGRLSVADSARLLEPVARALAYAHRRHVVHRDVKPSNILLRRVGADTQQAIQLAPLNYRVVPLLSDFGIALALDSPELTAAGRTVGTPTYMAPEQAADSHDIDGRADIYALGIVLYRCLVGRPPFVGATTQILHAHVYEPLTIPDEVAASLPPVILEILQRALAKHPNDRYPDVALLGDDLALVGGSGTGREMDQPTATMPFLPSTAAPTAERLQVLIPAPGSRTTGRTGASPLRASPPGREEAVQPHRTPAPQRRQRPARNWAGLLLGSLSALLLVVMGILILRTVLPVDRLLVQWFVPAPAPTGVAATTPTVALATVTAGPSGQTPPALAVEPNATPTAGAIVAPTPPDATPSPAPSLSPTVPTPAPTIDIDVELFWDIVVEDFNRRDWNKTLGNLILILRSESDSFNQALSEGAESQAELVRTLLDDDTAPVWAQRRSLFDPARIEEMLFAIYVGQATAANTGRAPNPALDRFEEALTLRPEATAIHTLRDATQRFLSADDAEREQTRQSLALAHRQYSDRLAAADDPCGAYEQLSAAASLLANNEFTLRQTELRGACESRQEQVAGQQLLAELSGSILYSTQEGNDYRIYRQLLAPAAPPILLVADGRQPRLAPDGQTLAFFNTRTNTQGMASLTLNQGLAPTERSQLLTTIPNDARDSPPTWSPDGSRLAFASIRESDGRPRIYTKAAVADNDAQILAIGQDPAWRPLGESWIAYNGRAPTTGIPGILLVSDDGNRWRQLTLFERDRRPVWSPDAQYIVFMSDGRDGNWEIYRLTLSADYQVVGNARLTSRPFQDGLPAISPDGKYVAFVSDQGNRWRIWVVPLDGSAKPLPVADIRGSLTNWLEHGIQWITD